MAAMIAFLLLLMEVNISTLIVENGHGSAAILRKWHRMVHLDQLMLRAFLGRVRVLFTLTPTQKKVKRFLTKLARLNRRRPLNFTGRQLYLRELVIVTTDSVAGSDFDGREWSQHCFKHHGSIYSQLPRAVQRCVCYRCDRISKHHVKKVLSTKHHKLKMICNFSKTCKW